MIPATESPRFRASRESPWLPESSQPCEPLRLALGSVAESYNIDREYYCALAPPKSIIILQHQ
jgi:hypothetical protein